MKKKKIIGYIKYFILGGIIFGAIGVCTASTLDDYNVYFDNSNTGVRWVTNSGGDTLDYMSSNNVFSSIVELQTYLNDNWVYTLGTGMGTPTNYLCNGENKPTTSSPTSPPSGRRTYLALYADGGYGVCMKDDNNTQHCFRYNNVIAERKHASYVFNHYISGGYCNYRTDGTKTLDCGAPGSIWYLSINTSGFTRIKYTSGSTSHNADIQASGSANCGA